MKSLWHPGYFTPECRFHFQRSDAIQWLAYSIMMYAQIASWIVYSVNTFSPWPVYALNEVTGTITSNTFASLSQNHCAERG